MDSGSQHVALQWARDLGLAATALFGGDVRVHAPGTHFAILDGRRASFACTEIDRADVDPYISKQWRWSADLFHHVLIHSGEVTVWSGRGESARRFERSSVERRLNEFLRFLDTTPEPALPDVVTFLLHEFRQMWGLMPSAETRGHAALAAFLTGLQAMGESDPRVFEQPEWRLREAQRLGLAEDLLDLVAGLPPEIITHVSTMGQRTPAGLRLDPALALRHAGGRLFQEAHGYLEAVQVNLFGDVSVRTVPTFSPSGAYFTPVPLARLLADLALAQYDRLPGALTVADYACGSAVFLTEIIHALERRAYRGEVRLVGRDVSDEAIIMAGVAIATAARGIEGFRITADLAIRDALSEERWPEAQIVLMNPPFRSWEGMESHERAWVKRLLGPMGGRADLSVGFIESALRALAPGGVVATLVPVGVLASERLHAWREALLDRSSLAAVAVLGEHDLFRHALVNVGFLVMRKRPHPGGPAIPEPLRVAWASPEPGAASNMMRTLRRQMMGLEEFPAQADAREWMVSSTTLETWQERPTWLPTPSILGPLHDAIREAVATRVEDLFRVQQGIRTGAIDVFLIDASAYTRLPRREQVFFAAAVDNASFEEGVIHPQRYVFIGDSDWKRESDVAEAVPTYFERFLKPARSRLRSRKDIPKEGHWWQLARRRGWTKDIRPRLVSKRFGLIPAFARDLDGRLAVVQGNAWAPTDRLRGDLDESALRELLTAYWWLFNSQPFVALLREYCPNVAGGQLDLEHKYVKHVPLPDLGTVVRESPELQQMTLEMHAAGGSDVLPPLPQRDAFAAASYGTSLDSWPIARDRY